MLLIIFLKNSWKKRKYFSKNSHLLISMMNYNLKRKLNLLKIQENIQQLQIKINIPAKLAKNNKKLKYKMDSKITNRNSNNNNSKLRYSKFKMKIILKEIKRNRKKKINNRTRK